jgi:porin
VFTLGRVKATGSDQVTAYAAIFNGNPARPGPGDPRLRDNHGQVRCSLDLGGSRLPGNLTPGAWYHTRTFDDQRFTGTGLSRPAPNSR